MLHSSALPLARMSEQLAGLATSTSALKGEPGEPAGSRRKSSGTVGSAQVASEDAGVDEEEPAAAAPAAATSASAAMPPGSALSRIPAAQKGGTKAQAPEQASASLLSKTARETQRGKSM